MNVLSGMENRTWWKEAVIYQIYPRSFMDHDGDGIGDLKGITAKLDYLMWLGVDVIWLSPVYKSPNDDNGYDISDYRAIMADFGTMEDFEVLLQEIHRRNMKLVMDLVVNHTSDEHEWFQQARSSKESPYRDYYIWKTGAADKSPNNWSSFFGGSVWQYDAQTEEHYLHLFSVKQPDLNWETPELRAEIYDMMRWWLDKGVDGFRMDVINAISKYPELPDAVGDGQLSWGGDFFLNGPRVHEYLQEMNREVLSRYDLVTVGETLAVTPEQALEYVGFDRQELNMVFQFELMDIDSGPSGKWDVIPWRLSDFKAVLSSWQTALHGRGWNSLYLNNHDQPRMVSRFGEDGEHRESSAKMLATVLHTLQGTPFIYQGEEIGMTNVRFQDISDYRDIETLNWYAEQAANGRASGDILSSIYAKGRDNARTPMQWDSTSSAGFTNGVPWLRVNPNYVSINVNDQLADPDSVLHYYRRLIQLRKQHLVMVYGDYSLWDPHNEATYAFERRLGDVHMVTLANFTSTVQRVEWFSEAPFENFQRIIGNLDACDDRHGHGAGAEVVDARTTVLLRPYEANVYVTHL